MLKPWFPQLKEAMPFKPLIRAVWHAAEDLLQGDLLIKNELLKNRYDGKRCFILGTGASLNEIDVSKLWGEYTFGCGELHSPELDYYIRSGVDTLPAQYEYPNNINPLKVSPSFFSAIDPIVEMFYSRDGVEWRVQWFKVADEAFGNLDTIFFLNATSKRFIDKYKLLQGRRVHYVKSASPMRAAAGQQSNDLTCRMTFLDGNIYFMIGAAVYLGFKELYLCGCGYTYHPRQVPHYYNDHTCLATDLEPVDPRHEIAKQFAEAHGVRIYNVVPDGFESPVYEKVSWAFIDAQLLKTSESHPARDGVVVRR